MIEVVSRARIEREAREAARAGMTLRDACPYPWHSDAATHFTAHFLCARQLPIPGGASSSPEAAHRAFFTQAEERA